MNSDLEKLFEQAVGLEGAQREEFLAKRCSDPGLRHQLEQLLAHDQGAESFLQSAVSAEACSVIQTLVLSPGERLGSYQVVSVIGSGGMGLVYLAERADGKFEQRVAIKVLQSGLNREAFAERIQEECRTLARLEHANVARVLDAGISPGGLPYFVMEYVDGQPIDRYCDQHKLTKRDRMRLLLPVCDAVHFAHQKLIVHRDLKPDNILVTGSGTPKLLDFGIAKVLSEVPVSPQNTATRVLTPEYASPEQARGEPVTTTTDIYSLGGVLYKLLTGSSPHQLQSKSPVEAVRIICEEDVRKPSELRRELAGEIDSILLKALHTDPQRRYRSVDQFAGDLQRWLEGKPVLAVPPSTAYRARKFARRHRVVLATTSAFALVLLLAALVSIREGVRANREAAVAEAVNEFLQNDLLAQAGASAQSAPNTKPDPDLKVRTALERAAERIEGKFAKQPEVEASIRDTMGWTYLDLGLYPEARKQLERALELRQRVLGTGDAKTAESMSRLGWVASSQGKYAEAEALLSRALEAQRHVLGPEHPDTLFSMSRLGTVYDNDGKYVQAEALDLQTLEIRKRVLGPEHPGTLTSMTTLANVYDSEGKFPQAETLCVQTLEARKRVSGPEHPDTLWSMNNLAIVYDEEGKYAQAEALHTQTLEIRRRVLGPEHPDTLSSMNELAAVDTDEGKFVQAEGLDVQILEIRKRLLGPEHPYTLNSMNNLANVYDDEGKYAQAEALDTQTLEIRRRVLGPEHRKTLSSMTNLAGIYDKEGKYALAEPLVVRALEIQKRVLGPEHPDTLLSMNNLADVYNKEGKYALAEPLFVQAVEVRKRVLGPEHLDTLSSMSNLADVYDKEGKFAQAERLFTQTLEIQKRVMGPEHPDAAETVYNLGCVAARRGDKEQAIMLLSQSVDHGLSPRADLGIERDTDLTSLHSDRRFAALVAHAKQVAETKEKAAAAQASQQP